MSVPSPVAAMPGNLYLILRHDLVLDRSGRAVHSSVTQVDVHDFCRLAATYGLGGVFMVTAQPSQRALAEEISAFWREGFGRTYNSDRHQALQLLQIKTHFEEALGDIEKIHGLTPILLGTSARSRDNALEFDQVSSIMSSSGRPAAVVFGTGWGLSPEQLNRCDWVLAPIAGRDGYNHLSVRCAAAIIVDRIVTRARIKTSGAIP